MNRVPRYGRACSARWDREPCSSFFSREGRSSVEVEGSSLTVLSGPRGAWELMALRLSRWYGAPELSSSARGREVEGEGGESDVKIMSRRFILRRNVGRNACEELRHSLFHTHRRAEAPDTW